MSAKKRKGLSAWAECDHCHAIISQRDTTLHREKSCPPNTEMWVHSFVMNNCLYSTVENIKSQERISEHIPKESRDDFVFLPLHVLQLCKIPIGDPVVLSPICSNKTAKFVKLAWPLQGKASDFSVELTNEVSNLYCLDNMAQVIVSQLQDHVHVAKEVILCEENKQDWTSNIEDLLQRLKKQNLNKIYLIGNKIIVKHYGRKTVFKIQDITPVDETECMGSNCYYIIGPESNLATSHTITELKKKQDFLGKLGGLNDVIEELKYTISFVMEEKNMSSVIHVAKGILIHGPMGTGKTTLIEGLAEHFTKNIVRIESSKIFSKIVGETEKELLASFAKAKEISPSIILIDDLDVLCTKSNASSEYETRIVATLAFLMDKINSDVDEGEVVVLATTSKIHLIDITLRSSTRFGKEVEIFVPNNHQRFEILQVLLENFEHELTEMNIKDIAESSHGFVGADLASLLQKAALKNYRSTGKKGPLFIQDLEWALTKVRPSAMKEIMIEVPNVRWEDIGGQDELKLKLKQCVEWPLKYQESFTNLGITPPKGLLMFGPPGCSKTMIAKALATESQLNFIAVKGPELFSKWVGESERAVRTVFRRARQAAPSIVFFDELDAIGGERNLSTGSNVQERVLAQMLIELDGVEPLDNVTVLAATNRPDRIDPALLRPGRLDRIVYVPLPDSRTRNEIFNIQLKKTRVDVDVVVSELVSRTEGYSGAEIVAVCREAALKALEEDFDTDRVSWHHFEEALKIVIPRTSKTLLDMYQKYLSQS